MTSIIKVLTICLLLVATVALLRYIILGNEVTYKYEYCVTDSEC